MTEDKKPKKSVVAKRLKRRRIIMLSVSVFALVSVCLFTPLFGISAITVEGNRVLDTDSVIRASGIKNGENVFMINTAKAERSVASLGHVESADVKRRFPSKIVIDVTECTEEAYVLFAGNYVGIDSELKVISISKASQKKADKPVISGMALKTFDKGEILTAAKENKAKALKKILASLKSAGLISSTEKIDVSDVNKLSFTLNSATVVQLGSAEKIDYKFSYLKEVLKSLDDVRGGEIDLSDTDNVIYKGGN